MPFDTQTLYPGIIIRMSNQADSVMFPSLVNDALAQIAKTSTGLKLLTGIAGNVSKSQFGYTVCIQRADMTYDADCATKWRGTNIAVRGGKDPEKSATTPGSSSVTAIKYNANMIDTPDGNRPSWVGLAHELIHAHYNLKGEGFPEGQKQMNVKGQVEKEEMATVGLGPGPHRDITENKIREEAKIPLRSTYGGM